MAIVVENGTGVAGANSYAGLADIRAYALARGVTLSAVDATLESMVIKAMDFLESYRNRFTGYRVDRGQSLSWPRNYAYVDGYEYPSTTLPQLLLDAEGALVMEVNAGNDPFNPPLGSLPVIRERVEGAVEVEYSDPQGQYLAATARPAVRLINQLLVSGGLFAVRA